MVYKIVFYNYGNVLTMTAYSSKSVTFLSLGVGKE